MTEKQPTDITTRQRLTFSNRLETVEEVSAGTLAVIKELKARYGDNEIAVRLLKGLEKRAQEPQEVVEMYRGLPSQEPLRPVRTSSTRASRHITSARKNREKSSE